MRFCSKTNCNCTLANCYHLTISDDIATISNYDTGYVLNIGYDELQPLLELGTLPNIEDNEFSPNVHRKFTDYISEHQKGSL